MTDLLVKLYDLPLEEREAVPANAVVRRAMAYEKEQVVAWVRANFGSGWASECDVAFANRPLSCHIATQAGEVVGFACYDSSSLGLFGPIGVAPSARGEGIGRALLLSCLRAMNAVGYAYAIVGGVGDAAFYRRILEILEIPGSTPGIYRDRLQHRVENLAKESKE